MSTLVVIDMQQSFIFRHDQFPRYAETIDAVKNEIADAKKRGDFIVYVEFCTESRRREKFNKFPSRVAPTLSELTNLTINYLDKVFVYKKTCDGGNEVLAALKHYQIPKKNIRVCGVYTNACVRETVHTLSEGLPNSTINVVGNAVASSGGDDWQHQNGLQMLKDMGNNVVII